MSDDLRRAATPETAAANRDVADALPLDDPADFERNDRGLVERPESLVLTRDGSDHVVWDMDRFAFIDGEAPETVNPSLWRQERLNNAQGLFELADRVYQVRGYDISNISFIEGDSGWIVIDPLTTSETARAALDLLFEHKGEKPVHAVIYTHSHADHFAGVLGVTSAEAVAAGAVAIIAPEGFLEAAVFENVIAGPAMLRRAAYMYGGQLPADPQGMVGSGLGRTLPVGGTSTLVAPTDEITHTGEERVIDGVRIVFQVTPDTEAPAEMNFVFPDLRALCMAENCTCVMHNVYTLRGAHIRDALAWSKYVHEALRLFAADVDLCFASHNWPVWGAEQIDHYLRCQRDTYRYIHDQTMRLANQGQTSTEVAEQLELPDSLADQFNNRGYYGTVSHNAKAVYQKYLGWFDANPANLHPLPPEDAGTRYVEFMGGADALLERARASFDAGEYRWVAQVVNHLVFAQPDNDDARHLQADALEQLGYQAEAGPWRNFYLTGAQELRHGVRTRSSAADGSPTGILRAMRVDMIFDLLGVRLDGPAADGRVLGVNWVFSDLDEQWTLRLEHGAVHYHQGLDDGADATLTLTHRALVDVLAGVASVEDAFGSGEIEVEGDGGALLDLFGLIDTEMSSRFNIVTP
jgi:alkyl sulfatase BDS1-like metallo-beta-lactamase superfamily hydrolase